MWFGYDENTTVAMSLLDACVARMICCLGVEILFGIRFKNKSDSCGDLKARAL